MRRGIRISLYGLATVLFIGTFFLFMGKICSLENNVVSLQEDLDEANSHIASIEGSYGTWPMRFETNTRGPMVYQNMETFLQDMYDRVVENEDFGYACERDFHNNPLLNYLFLEAHSQIDGENDPVRYYPFDRILAQQAISWERMRSDDLYMAYDVIYDKAPD